LQRLAWYGHCRLFQTDHACRGAAKNWPQLSQELHPDAGLFWAVVLLSGVPTLLQRHRARGIPLDTTLDTLSDLELWIQESNQEGKGKYWTFKHLAWLENHFSCELVKLGRLQFEFSRFSAGFHAFRHRHDGRVRILAGEGMRFRADGQFYDADRMVDEKAWTAHYQADGQCVRGHVISPSGRALAADVCLFATEWTEILRQEDPVLATHIPATGPMNVEDCRRSYESALMFFPRHFPEYPFKAFTCTSWLLDPQFEQYMPEANIVRFQQLSHLLPAAGANDQQTFDRVFGGPIANLDQAPQDNSLRRAIVQHCRKGGHWRMTGSVLFPDDVAKGSGWHRGTLIDQKELRNG
jgi:hypothetical protein